MSWAVVGQGNRNSEHRTGLICDRRPRASIRAAGPLRAADAQICGCATRGLGAAASWWTAPRPPAAVGGAIRSAPGDAHEDAGAGARGASLPGSGRRRPCDRGPRAAIRATVPGALVRQQPWWTAPRSPAAAGEPIPTCGGPLRGRRRPCVDGSAVSCGCWRPDPDVRQTAPTTMAARGRMANRCAAPLPAAKPSQSCRFRPPSRLPHSGRRPCERGPGAAIRAAAPPGAPPLVAFLICERAPASSSALVSAGGDGFSDRCPAPPPAARPNQSCRLSPLRGGAEGPGFTARTWVVLKRRAGIRRCATSSGLRSRLGCR